jgi:glycosyltransferase involved in cell wall biosynthesis
MEIKKPLISVCLVTRQVMHPMVKYYRDIFGILLESLHQQTFRKNIELIIVDGFYKLRAFNFEELCNPGRMDFPFKYIPPKPSPWLDNRGYKACNDRNSAIIMSSGELIVILDDCTIPSNTNLLKQMWDCYKNWILLKPLLYHHDYREYNLKVLIDDLVPWSKTQADTENFVRIGDTRFLESSGHRGGVFSFPAWLYEAVNGFDEEMDGDYGSEDTEINERIDAHGYVRYIMEGGQHPFIRVHHDEFKEKNKTLVRHRCNISYIQWKRNAGPEIKMSANQRKVEVEDLEKMVEVCDSCPSIPTCERRIGNLPPGLELYQKNFRSLNIKQSRDKITRKFWKKTGAFDPWQ